LPRPRRPDIPKILAGSHDCPKCGFPMLLAIIEPTDHDGSDRRTYECLICHYVETAVVNFASS
jgi:ribosomal protein S27AE